VLSALPLARAEQWGFPRPEAARDFLRVNQQGQRVAAGRSSLVDCNSSFDRELRASVEAARLDSLEDSAESHPWRHGRLRNGFRIGGQQANLDAITELS
jgi:hypothetical protein